MWTYRIKYAKLGRIRFISHLDVKRAITRTLMRANVPLAYSQGFNPHPKISLGPPLPLGYESTCEVADVVLAENMPEESLRQMLEAVMPKGLDLMGVERVSPSSTKLSQASSAHYVIELPEQEIADNAYALVKAFLEKKSVIIERVRKDTRKTVDIRYFVTGAIVAEEADSRWLHVDISMSGQGSCSASEVARTALNLSPERSKCLRIMRTELRLNGRSAKVKMDEKDQKETNQEKSYG